MQRVKILIALILLAILAACSQPGQQQTQSEPSQQPAAPAGSGQPSSGPARTAAPAAPSTPSAPAFASLPSGTRFEIRLSDTLNSAENKAGDTFEATLDENLITDGKILAPRGSKVIGKVIAAIGSGRVKGKAGMSISLTEIRVRDVPYPMQTNTLSFEAEGSQK